MPRSVAMINKFMTGTITTPADADIPMDAAAYSLNIEPQTETGLLHGIPEDSSLYTDESITGDIVGLGMMRSDIGDDYVMLVNNGATYYLHNIRNESGFSYDSTFGENEIESDGSFASSSHNYELHIGLGGTETSIPQWCGYLDYDQFGATHSEDLQLLDARLLNSGGFPPIYKVVKYNDDYYGVSQNRNSIYKFVENTDGDMLTFDEEIKLEISSVAGKIQSVDVVSNYLYFLTWSGESNYLVVYNMSDSTIASTNLLDFGGHAIESEKFTDIYASTASRFWVAVGGVWGDLVFTTYAWIWSHNGTINTNADIVMHNCSLGAPRTDAIGGWMTLTKRPTHYVPDRPFVAKPDTAHAYCLMHMDGGYRLWANTNAVFKTSNGNTFEMPDSSAAVFVVGYNRTADAVYGVCNGDSGNNADMIILSNSDAGENSPHPNQGYDTGSYLIFSCSRYHNFKINASINLNDEVMTQNNLNQTTHYSESVYDDFVEDATTIIQSNLEAGGYSYMWMFSTSTSGAVHRMELYTPDFTGNTTYVDGAGFNDIREAIFVNLSVSVEEAIPGLAEGLVDAGDVYWWAASFVYDGYQESPLSPPSRNGFDAVADAGFRIRIRVADPSVRVTALRLYRAEGDDGSMEPQGLFRLVEEYPLDGTWASSGAGVYILSVDDTMRAGATFESNSGLSESIKQATPHYGLSCVMADKLVIGKCWLDEIEAAKYLFISNPGNYDQFNWIDKFVVLDEAPTALAYYSGRGLAFVSSKLYVIDLSLFAVISTLSGYGVPNEHAVLSTDYGVFYANDANIYLWDGSHNIPIGTPILKGDYGYETHSDVRLLFDRVRQAVVVTFTTGNDKRAWVFSIGTKRWDYWEAPADISAHGVDPEGRMVTVSADGDITHYLGASTYRDWSWYSKHITAEQDVFRKRFYQVRAKYNYIGDTSSTDILNRHLESWTIDLIPTNWTVVSGAEGGTSWGVSRKSSIWGAYAAMLYTSDTAHRGSITQDVNVSISTAYTVTFWAYLAPGERTDGYVKLTSGTASDTVSIVVPGWYQYTASITTGSGTLSVMAVSPSTVTKGVMAAVTVDEFELTTDASAPEFDVSLYVDGDEIDKDLIRGDEDYKEWRVSDPNLADGQYAQLRLDSIDGDYTVDALGVIFRSLVR